ncbi:MAG TPA: M23 family metallopeptidase [Candidatus Paceibacterota bacterium]|jgi:murein DD-endopeptidase MepM/ murein hydrolase activator NlpD
MEDQERSRGWQQWVFALGVAAFVFAINYNNHVWHATPLPRVLGESIHAVRVTSDHAAYTASLLASPAAALLPVPVVGVPSSEVADTFGAPRGTDRTHQGVDIFAPRGTYILSATEGIVARIGTNGLGGNVVFVLGPGGERYYYAHLDEVDPVLELGQRVSTTTIIGRVGTTGNAAGTPPHLHFGIYGAGGAQNPFSRLD